MADRKGGNGRQARRVTLWARGEERGIVVVLVSACVAGPERHELIAGEGTE